jgi:HD superfamily phosphodiesterase
MNYPSREEAIGFYKEIGTPENIIMHVKTVNKVAVFIGQKLVEKGTQLDLRLVDAASLLHDLDKWICINDKNAKHGFETERLLTEKGYPEVGYFARQHRANMVSEKLETWEEKVIAYADKRVMGDKIVPMSDRMVYVKKKYPPKSEENHQEVLKQNNLLEQEIFSDLDFKPADLAKLVPG